MEMREKTVKDNAWGRRRKLYEQIQGWRCREGQKKYMVGCWDKLALVSSCQLLAVSQWVKVVGYWDVVDTVLGGQIIVLRRVNINDDMIRPVILLGRSRHSLAGRTWGGAWRTCDYMIVRATAVFTKEILENVAKTVSVDFHAIRTNRWIPS